MTILTITRRSLRNGIVLQSFEAVHDNWSVAKREAVAMEAPACVDTETVAIDTSSIRRVYRKINGRECGL